MPYREVAAKARAHLDGLADLYATPTREAELIAIFKEATWREADFWESHRIEVAKTQLPFAPSDVSDR